MGSAPRKGTPISVAVRCAPPSPKMHIACSSSPTIRAAAAQALAMAGKTLEQIDVAKRLVAAYPDEFTFHHGYARLLYEQKEYPAALASARAALTAGYGDNRLRAAALEAAVHVTGERPPQSPVFGGAGHAGAVLD